MATPYVSVELEETGSTQDEAWARAAEAPIVVVAHSQGSGRGRSGRTWESAPRSVAASLALVLDWPPTHLPVVSLVAALAAVDVRPGLRCKWPNDLVNDEGKVGGILAEARNGMVVVGIGLNVYWPNPPEDVAALEPHDPGPAVVPAMAKRWTEAMLLRIGAGFRQWDRERYRRLCTTLGRDVTWAGGGRGLALDVDLDGSLIVESEDGIQRLRSGEVREIRPV